MAHRDGVALAVQIAEVRRELAIRQRAYPQWVSRGQLTPANAAHRLQAMQAVLRTLEAVAEAAAVVALEEVYENPPPF